MKFRIARQSAPPLGPDRAEFDRLADQDPKGELKREPDDDCGPHSHGTITRPV